MGVVHLAWDPRPRTRGWRSRSCRPRTRTIASDAPGSCARLARRAALNHPNIATVYDVGEADGRDYVALERIEGQNLHELLEARRLSIDEVLELALPLAEALAYAHERGVIHRDVKAANVMLTAEGAPKLLDFGLAKFEGGVDRTGAPELTQSGAILGTPGAMSPEQAQGRPVDARSDVFSFGSLLYELVAGSARLHRRVGDGRRDGGPARRAAAARGRARGRPAGAGARRPPGPAQGAGRALPVHARAARRPRARPPRRRRRRARAGEEVAGRGARRAGGACAPRLGRVARVRREGGARPRPEARSPERRSA